TGRGPGRLRRPGHRRPARGERATADRDGLPETECLSDDVELRQRGGRSAVERRAGEEETRPGGAGEPETSRPLGRGEGLARQERGQPVRRAAATAVHRPPARGEAGGAPEGRALLRPRSDRDGE